ncbi:MAG TPA: LLM class flavin-dependent oxidoreductase [Streptosporangiaceae bacterium]|nr:LLM class flavin-dependent oxidoreductase [Streptosporangiaceae bacterium]
MIVGFGVDGRYGFSAAEHREIARSAAALGFGSLWTNAVTIPDPFHVCALWAEAAGGAVRTGISVIGALNWKPQSLAGQAATVSLLSGGRFTLGIGTGGAGVTRRPIATMADYLAVLRPLLSGEEVVYRGQTMDVERFRVGGRFPRVPVYLAALGPQMLRLAGRAADGAALSFATPAEIARSADLIAAGAQAAGRDRADIALSMYLRVCIDDDAGLARQAFAVNVLGYALARPGTDKRLAYRGLFGRMGYDEALSDLEARRDRGAGLDELARRAPDDMLRAVGYFGPAAGAAGRFATLSAGLDETIVRYIAARPGVEPLLAAMDTLAPARILA